MNHPIKITFLTTSLEIGGAECMLEKLISSLNKNRFHITIISLTTIGPIGASLIKNGFNVQAFNFGQSVGLLPKLFSFLKYIRKQKPDIIQTWMYHADFLGIFCKIVHPKSKLIWGIHNNELHRTDSPLATIIIRKFSALLSYFFPSKIICCANKVLETHRKKGYQQNKLTVIQNGIKLSQDNELKNFQPIAELPKDNLLVGHFARFHPHKDHYNLIQAAKHLVKTLPKVTFILCGDQITMENPSLSQWIIEENLQNNFLLLGLRKDLGRIYPSLDLFVLSSKSEGFPIVVLEAMSNKIPCVVTDVGDAAEIVTDSGWVVPSENPIALADAIKNALRLTKEERSTQGVKAAKRINDVFNLEKCVLAYENLYESVLNK